MCMVLGIGSTCVLVTIHTHTQTSMSYTNGSVHHEQDEIRDLMQQLMELRSEMVATTAPHRSRLSRIHANYRHSARNLLHYLTLRRRDMRHLQLRLAALGLSSLGRAESHVLATIDSVLHLLHRLAGETWEGGDNSEPAIDFRRGQRLLQEHTEQLLGPPAQGRTVRIMVTMPSEAADDYTLIYNLLKGGMECMRINCAHDDRDSWMRMIDHLRRAEQALGKSCIVVMDLAGPKLRTGPLHPGPAVARVRPRRDAYGRVLAPARLWLTSDDDPRDPPSPADAILPLPEEWLLILEPDEKISFVDARGSRRTITVVDVAPGGVWGELDSKAYIVPGTILRVEGGGPVTSERVAPVGPLPHDENWITLREGDLLTVTRDQRPGRDATHDSAGNLLTPASIGCTLPEVFDDVARGEPIWFDDGRIGGVVESVDQHHATVRITYADPNGARLRADKGINLPDSRLKLAALTDADIDDLVFVSAHADIVAMSFANSSRDVEALQNALVRLGGNHPSIVLKIETRRGFENLPQMLLTAMRARCCGVMIARGDLAVECGFERLAEAQEEILWICEAAHVPVIWATQVLETLAKKGMPSRAEITDAAMGHRAECVMLNKGPHVVKAVSVLDDILRRMQAHQAKKRAMLRELHLAHVLPYDPPTITADEQVNAGEAFDVEP